MPSGLGGSTNSTTKVPAWLEEAGQGVVAGAQAAGQTGYVPYFGPEVAAFTPGQEAAFRNNISMATDLGLQAPTHPNMPVAQDFGGGVHGYGSYAPYKQAIDQLAAVHPAQFDYINSFVIDPVTGVPGQRAMTYGAGQPAGPNGAPGASGAPLDTGDAVYGDNGVPVTGTAGAGGLSLGGLFGGYNGPIDMIDGGGPGASGGAYQGGGLLSDMANRVRGR